MTAVDEVHPDRLAETEYTALADPERVRRTAFGRFAADARFPGRHDANHYFDIRCSAKEVGALLESVESLYAPTGLPFRKLSGHELETMNHLPAELIKRSWTVDTGWMMRFENPSAREANPEVRIKVAEAGSEDLKRIKPPEDFDTERHAYYAVRDRRLGGEVLVAYLEGRPVGASGWYVVDGIARYRPVYVHPDFRNLGVASTLLLHVQGRPTVQARDALTIHVADDGPVNLYEQLGFVKHSRWWEALLEF